MGQNQLKYILLSLVLLTGCATAPVVAKFPTPPLLGQTACPQLQTVNDTVKLSELTTTIAQNYSTYYECAVRVDIWQEWYRAQKQIFESIK